MACQKPCVFKLWKNKRECLYSVKSSIGTEPTESELAHSIDLDQFEKPWKLGQMVVLGNNVGEQLGQQFQQSRYKNVRPHSLPV